MCKGLQLVRSHGEDREQESSRRARMDQSFCVALHSIVLRFLSLKTLVTYLLTSNEHPCLETGVLGERGSCDLCRCFPTYTRIRIRWVIVIYIGALSCCTPTQSSCDDG
jgi:hypothetical protein